MGFSQSLPRVSSGSIQRIEKFPSRFVTARNVDIWLPDGYDTSKKYSVVYMHDGQMLFDSTLSWNKKEWGVDETFANLIKLGKIQECIVVGIWNVPEDRFADYFPQKVIPNIAENIRTRILKEQLKQEPKADNYLKFIVQELKPTIDKTYSTSSNAENTFLIGSSMGGLISLYGLCEYPDVFGGAACMSTHTPLAAPDLINAKTDEQVASKLRDYLEKNLPKANTKKIYFDYGSLTLDAYYKPFQTKIDTILKNKGYDSTHWQTREFQGADHSETSWSKRLDIPLLFLLSTKSE
jgi:enterochelin esterase-like enzyme